MEKHISIYYQDVTPESAEHGDFAAQGDWDLLTLDVKSGETIASLIEDLLNEYGGPVGASSSDFHPNIWYLTLDPTQDNDYYTKGRERYYSFHPENFTREEQLEIYNRLIGMD